MSPGSLCLPFFPRFIEYRPLEDVVARNPAGWSYQLYFANEASNEEIGSNARPPLRVYHKIQTLIIRFHSSRYSTVSCTVLQFPQSCLVFRNTLETLSPARSSIVRMG